MKLTILSFLLTIAFASNAQDFSALSVGDSVPDYHFNVLYPTKNQATKLSDLKGKVVIIDFWATWCGPCLQRMQELHKLYQSYKKDIVVLAISDEDPKKISRFANNTNYSFSFVADSSFRGYFPHKVIPHTVIIDRGGKVSAITDPAEITATVLTDLVNNRTVSLKIKNDFQLLALGSDSTHSVLYQFEVTKYDPQKNTAIVSEDDRLEFNNFTLPSLFREVFQLPAHSWIIDNIQNRQLATYRPENLYCLRLYKPRNSNANLYNIGQSIVSSTLPISAKKKLTDRTVYLLRISNATRLKRSESQKPYMEYFGPNYKGLNQPISVLIDYLSNEKAYLENAPVIDETNLRSKYDIVLNWAYEKPETLLGELKKYGLTLVKQQRKINCLVLTD